MDEQRIIMSKKKLVLDKTLFYKQKIGEYKNQTGYGMDLGIPGWSGVKEKCRNGLVNIFIL
jgi:hypothetical protein